MHLLFLLQLLTMADQLLSIPPLCIGFLILVPMLSGSRVEVLNFSTLLFAMIWNFWTFATFYIPQIRQKHMVWLKHRRKNSLKFLHFFRTSMTIAFYRSLLYTPIVKILYSNIYSCTLISFVNRNFVFLYYVI